MVLRGITAAFDMKALSQEHDRKVEEKRERKARQRGRQEEREVVFPRTAEQNATHHHHHKVTHNSRSEKEIN